MLAQVISTPSFPRFRVWHLLAAIPLIALLQGCGKKDSAPFAATSVPMEAGFDVFSVSWVRSEVPAKMKHGQTVLVPVAVKNVGTRPIPPKYLSISYHWYDAADQKKVVVYDGVRTPFTKDLDAGQTFETQAKVQAPDQPGRYLLVIDLVRDMVTWFGDRGVPTVKTEVEVD